MVGEKGGGGGGLAFILWKMVLNCYHFLLHNIVKVVIIGVEYRKVTCVTVTCCAFCMLIIMLKELVRDWVSLHISSEMLSC